MKSLNSKCIKHLLFLLIMIKILTAQSTNRSLDFVPGGDMSKFSLKENTPVGTPVYQLKGTGSKNGQLHYSISGQQFTVDRYSGVVMLQQPLDRETQDIVEVIISITDENIRNAEPNTYSLQRKIIILDENDNSPMFHNRPYRANVTENSKVGSVVLTTSEIVVTDLDEGVNADIVISCYVDIKLMSDDDVCKTFSIYTEKISEGRFKAHISLLKNLDFEQRSSYILTLKATDSGTKPLHAFASVAIDVIDVQDQPPFFINAPYSATIAENTPAGTSILSIKAKDGDTGNPRPLFLSLEGDDLKYFELRMDKGTDEAILVTSSNMMDRENTDVLQNGGIYTFFVKATELINNELPSEFATTQITIVITDVDDQIPTFNKNKFEIDVSEDISNNTPLPGLNIVVLDNDIGINSRFNLSLENVENSEGIFDIVPKYGEGRTPITIKVIDTSNLDFDVADISKHTLKFRIFASVHNQKVTHADIIVHLVDSNDNAPIFESNIYRLHVFENATRGHKIADIKATDKDSGKFGEITYYLRGFGSEKFKTAESSGGLYVEQKLDYETQKSYSLTLEAMDGGGKINSLNIFVEVDDVNDNSPIFESREYMRTIKEGALSFEPQLFVHATDVDGPSQGGGKIYYTLESTNSISETMNESSVFSVDVNSGEIKIERPVRAMDTPRGQYDLIVRATDGGKPPMHNETRVLVRVGIIGNQRPIFKGNYNPVSLQFLPGVSLMHYKATIKENAAPGTNVTTVQAMDPDGIDSFLNYYITGGHKDNFLIDKKSGVITTSSYSNLDLDINPKNYNIIVHAVDNGQPVHETATATVFVTIEDVNNKLPIFNATSSIAYISERAKTDEFVINVKAFDEDENAKLEYSILEPILAKDKTGVALIPSKKYDFKHAFKINEKGNILVNNSVNFKAISVIMLTVQAKDINAEINKDKQIAKTEVTIYIQAYSDDNPIFMYAGGESKAQSPEIQTTFDSQSNSYHIKIQEEQPIGYKILMLQAKDPVTDSMIRTFNLSHSGTDLFTVLQNGEIILTKRLNFESLDDKVLSLSVMAVSDDRRRTTEAKIFIEVLDINDNAPVFEQDSYKVSILESKRYPEKVLIVKAVDLDKSSNSEHNSSNTPQNRYGDIRYSLSGDSSNYFIIDEITGVIQLSPNSIIDREHQSVLHFNVTATDTPNGGSESLKTTIPITVDVLDVNDNAPLFNSKSYITVIAENAVIGSSVVNITATDPDEGLGGEITYDILDESEVNGLFKINSQTGEIKTWSPLTGKGRIDPYLLTIQAQDGAGLYSDVSLKLYIGDVSANDGVPTISEPTPDQVAYISENSAIGSSVFQIIATDPDDPALPSGKLTYKLLNDGLDYFSFRLDPVSGLLTTKSLLDREKQELYTLGFVVHDNGSPPQEAKRILKVQVTDIDDHKPHFVRQLDDEPIILPLTEEIEIGSTVGEISAIDEDIGENGAIDYLIISGNEQDWFVVERTENNSALIKTANRIDREEFDQHLLTIKCFKASEKKLQVTRKPYNRLDPSELQVLIPIKDIDDNVPKFKKNNFTIGVRLNVPIDTILLNLEAVDVDSDALPIKYEILSMNFTPKIDFGDKIIPKDVFRINEHNGELRTAKGLVTYVDGIFNLLIRANNSISNKHHANTSVQIHVIRDRDLLKFVFSKPPADVRKILGDFENLIQSSFDDPNLKLHIYDTQFHLKRDNSLDFSSTSSCFQLVGKDTLSPQEMMDVLLKEKMQEKLKPVYDKFHVNNVESCALISSEKKGITIVQLLVLLLGGFIGLATVIASCTLCCLSRRTVTAL